MSSNKEASKIAPEEGAEQIPIVHDRRRFKPDGEPIVAEVTEEESPDEPPAASQEEVILSSEIDQLQARLKEAEEMRAEAERKAADVADRFRQMQNQLKAETEEQRARIQRNLDQKLENARSDIVTSLLDTLDNLKRAVAAAEKSERRDGDFDSLLEGIRATVSMF